MSKIPQYACDPARLMETERDQAEARVRELEAQLLRHEIGAT